MVNAERMKIVIGVGLSVAVILTMWVYLSQAGPDFATLGVSAIVFIIVGFAIFVIFGRAKSLRRGLPAQDELSRRTMQKAGYYAWLVTIYIALGVSYFSDEIGIIGRHVGFIVILGSSITFFLFYFWFSRRGDA